MATLNAEQKAFIVVRLACYESPSEVIEAFADRFAGVRPSPSQVSQYDASSSVSRRRMTEDMSNLFDTTREAFKSDVSAIPIANRAVRLSRLDRLSKKAEDMGAIGLAASLMEQAAKECGDVYTNKQAVDLTTGGHAFKAFRNVDTEAV